MSKNPKIEFYKIKLHTIDEGDVTFRNIFTSNLKEYILSQDGGEIPAEFDPTQTELMTDFFRLFFDRIGKGIVKNESKRKAFQARKQEPDEVVNDSITLASDNNMIYGRIKGGEYDTGKYIGEIDSLKTSPKSWARKN